MFNFKTSTAVEDSYLLKSKRETRKQRVQQNAVRASKSNNQSVQKSIVQECDPDTMVRKPMTDKCDVECLFEYHFHNSLIHTCDYHKEQDMLCIGTGRGFIINYDIRVEPDSVRLDFKAKQRVQFQNQGPEKVVDRDTKQQASQAMVIIKQFVQYESKLPVYKLNELENKNENDYQQDGSSGDDSGFDDESDAEGSDSGKKRAGGEAESSEPKEKKLQVELYRTGVI